jgi:hypothetical protein
MKKKLKRDDIIHEKYLLRNVSADSAAIIKQIIFEKAFDLVDHEILLEKCEKAELPHG